MLDSIAEFATKDSPTSLQRVRIVIYSAPHQLAHFQEALQKKLDDIKSGHSGYHWLKVRTHMHTESTLTTRTLFSMYSYKRIQFSKVHSFRVYSYFTSSNLVLVLVQKLRNFLTSSTGSASSSSASRTQATRSAPPGPSDQAPDDFVLLSGNPPPANAGAGVKLLVFSDSDANLNTAERMLTSILNDAIHTFTFQADDSQYLGEKVCATGTCTCSSFFVNLLVLYPYAIRCMNIVCCICTSKNEYEYRQQSYS